MMSGTDGKAILLEQLEAKVQAEQSPSAEEMENTVHHSSIPELERQLKTAKKLLDDPQVQCTGNVNLPQKVAELEEELKHRKTSQIWLARVWLLF